MAKKTLAFFLALCLAVALTALGEEEIVLKISAVPDFLEQEPEFFKKQHPNVTIQVDGGYNIPPPGTGPGHAHKRSGLRYVRYTLRCRGF